MFDYRTDHLAPGRMRGSDATNREVIRLGAATGENDLARSGADKPCDLRAGPLQCATSVLAASMNGGGICCLVRRTEPGDSGAHLGSQWRAGVMVEINTHTGLIGPG